MTAAASPVPVPDLPLQAALYYAAIGLHIFPLAPKSKVPATAQGYHDATTDEAQIRAWWGANPRYGIGLDCHDSGIVALDIDPRHDGPATLATLQAELGALPATVRAITGSDGEHLLFHRPAELHRARGSLGPGLDVKLNGYLVVAPSVHPDTGRRYRWAVAPGTVPLAELPHVWLARLTVNPAVRAPTAPQRRVAGTSSRYGLAALEGECSALRRTPEGGRNNRLNQASFGLIGLVEGGELDESDAYAALLEAGVACGLPEGEVRRTIAGGFRDGRLFPRRAPPRPESSFCSMRPPGAQPESPPDTDEQFALEAPPDWRDGLAWKVGENGARSMAKTPGNMGLVLANHPDWQGSLGYDELACREVWLLPPPDIAGRGFRVPSGQVAEEHCTYVQHWFRVHYTIDFGRESTLRAVALAAQTGRFHPVQQYLDGLTWDGEPRVALWLANYLGAADAASPVGRWWLISAVARAFRPGCQVDHTLILEGYRQGEGKSSALRILAGDWYQGKLGDITDKDGVQSLLGSWIVEIGELDAFRGKEATRIKDFLTQTVDRYRPSYGHFRVDRPRGCIFAGTTNEAIYLHDTTGSRRFWPVTVGAVDLAGLERDRDQLWAEAVHLYRAGARWWPVGDGEHAQLRDRAEDRLATDPWEERLREFFEDPGHRTVDGWTVREILLKVCDLPTDRQTRYDAMRAGALLRRLGFERTRTMAGGQRTYRYRVSEGE